MSFKNETKYITIFAKNTQSKHIYYHGITNLMH